DRPGLRFLAGHVAVLLFELRADERKVFDDERTLDGRIGYHPRLRRQGRPSARVNDDIAHRIDLAGMPGPNAIGVFLARLQRAALCRFLAGLTRREAD